MDDKVLLRSKGAREKSYPGKTFLESGQQDREGRKITSGTMCGVVGSAYQGARERWGRYDSHKFVK